MLCREWGKSPYEEEGSWTRHGMCRPSKQLLLTAASAPPSFPSLCAPGFLAGALTTVPSQGHTSLLPSFCDLLEQTTDFLSSGTFPMLCSLPDMQIRLEYFPLQVTKKKSNSMQFKQTVAMKLIGTFTRKSQGLIDDMAESINLPLPCPLSWHHTLSCRAFRGWHGQHWAPLHWLSICLHWPYYVSSWEDSAAWVRSSTSGRNASYDRNWRLGVARS